MLWLCLHFPHLPAEALALRDPLDAVTASHGARRWLITPAAGLPAGTPLGDALARQPELRAQHRKPAAERAALKRLAHALYRYGHPVCAEIQEMPEPGRSPRALAWVEIGASLRLFGGIDALCAALREDLDQLQQTARLGIAPTRAAAALFAVAGHEVPVTDNADLRAQLERLPSALLPWMQPEIDALHGMGLRHLDALFALPRAGFAQQFGHERLLELDRLRDLAPDPMQAITPPPVFSRRFELSSEVENLEALLFVLRRMSFELQAWLRARDTGVQSIELQCEHARQQRSRFGLRFVGAHRDGTRIFEALRERLSRDPLIGPVRALRLSATDLGAVPDGQLPLFSADSDAGLQWSATVERLLARLGESALWTPVVAEDHRPERAMEKQALLQAAPHAAGAGAAKDRPLWLLPTPVPLPAQVQVQIRGEPEHIASGWWDGQDARRDYYTTDWQNAAAWVFRDVSSGGWYLHGWWA